MLPRTLWQKAFSCAAASSGSDDSHPNTRACACVCNTRAYYTCGPAIRKHAHTHPSITYAAQRRTHRHRRHEYRAAAAAERSCRHRRRLCCCAVDVSESEFMISARARARTPSAFIRSLDTRRRRRAYNFRSKHARTARTKDGSPGSDRTATARRVRSNCATSSQPLPPQCSSSTRNQFESNRWGRLLRVRNARTERTLCVMLSH